MESDFRRIRTWFDQNRGRLSDKGLWLLGEEPGMPDPGEFSQARLRVLIARMSPYHDVATGITHSLLFQLARQVEGVFADFAYLPPPRDEEIMRKDGIPLWVATTTKRPPQDFDLILLSNSVVQELLNLPALLEFSGLPLSREARAEKGAPFILMGGSNAYATSVLHGRIREAAPESGLIDGVLVGDGEVALPKLLERLAQAQTRSRDLLPVWRREIPGFYDPGSYVQTWDQTGRLTGVTAINGAPLPVRAHRAVPASGLSGFTGGPIFYDEDAAGRSHLQVTMGCPYFCSFCKESWEQKPYREFPARTLRETALNLKAGLGLSELTLMSFNANTYSGIHPLLNDLDTLFHRVILKSQRFDAISFSPQLLERQVELGKRTFTCAMEGISQRLRKLLQKNLAEKDLIKGFSVLLANNIRQMKVFLIVTGLETSQDILEFAGFLSQLNDWCQQSRSKPVFTFSLAALFRPPLTPFQFMPRQIDAPGFHRIFGEIERVVKKAGFSARISAGPSDALVSEILAYADRRFTPLLVSAALDHHQRYYGSMEEATLTHFQRELTRRPELQRQLETPGDARSPFPWDDVATGVSREFLWKTYQALMSGEEGQSCLAPPFGKGACNVCGACADREQIRILTTHHMEPAPPAVKTGKDPAPVRLRLVGEVGSRLAWVGNHFLFAAFARMLMLGKPQLRESFLRFEQGIPRPGFAGVFHADLLLRPPALPLTDLDLAACNRFGGALTVVTVGLAAKPLTEAFPPLLGVFHWPTSRCAQISREVDEVLVRYGLRHQKQWQGDILHWTLQAGHAKKAGFSRLRWRRDVPRLVMDLHQPVEDHLFNKLSGGGEREFRFPEDQVLHV